MILEFGCQRRECGDVKICDDGQEASFPRDGNVTVVAVELLTSDATLILDSKAGNVNLLGDEAVDLHIKHVHRYAHVVKYNDEGKSSKL